jgi:hypothetical protein
VTRNGRDHFSHWPSQQHAHRLAGTRSKLEIQSQKGDYDMNVMKTLVATFLALGLVMDHGLQTPAWALECPLPQHVHGKLLMSADEMRALGRRLLDDTSGNAVPEAAADLRSKDPKLSVSKIVDVLVGAYCAGIASEGLEDAVAKGKMRVFAKQTLDRLNK